jgi:hypothetical protein
MHGRLSLCEALFQGLPSHVQDVSAALRELIEKEHAVVRQGDLTRHREVPPADQPDIQDRVTRGAEGASGDDGRPPTGGASDAMDTGGLDGFSEPHIGKDHDRAV